LPAITGQKIKRKGVRWELHCWSKYYDEKPLRGNKPRKRDYGTQYCMHAK